VISAIEAKQNQRSTDCTGNMEVGQRYYRHKRAGLAAVHGEGSEYLLQSQN